ncbi:MAG: hypothetical protein ACM3MB_10910 [Acidobacteriota bacterium]
MKKMFLIGLVFVLTFGFLLAATPRADAMNNESAAMLAGAIVLFGGPILHAMASDTYRPAPVYVETPAVSYHTTRTEIIYDRPVYRNCRKPFRGAYERGWRDERARYYYGRGRGDARRGFYGDY